MPLQRTLAIGGRINVRLVSNLTALDLTKGENVLFVCSEAVENNVDELTHSDPSSYGECCLVIANRCRWQSTKS